MFIFSGGAISSWPLGALVQGRLTRACYNLKRVRTLVAQAQAPGLLKQAGSQADCLQVRALKLVSKDEAESARERRGRGGGVVWGQDHTDPLPGQNPALCVIILQPCAGKSSKAGAGRAGVCWHVASLPCCVSGCHSF